MMKDQIATLMRSRFQVVVFIHKHHATFEWKMKIAHIPSHTKQGGGWEVFNPSNLKQRSVKSTCMLFKGSECHNETTRVMET